MKKRFALTFKRMGAWLTAVSILAAGAAVPVVRGQSTAAAAPQLVMFQDFENYSNTFESGFVSDLLPTTDPAEVISGNASGVLDKTGGLDSYQNGMWQIGYRTRRNTEYTLTFKYKFISLTPGSRFYMIARTDSIGPADDRYFFLTDSNDAPPRNDESDWYNFNIIDKGEYRHVRFSFHSGDCDDRYLMWGIQGTGRVTLDDVALHIGHAGVDGELLAPVAESPDKPHVTQDFDGTVSNMVLAPGQTEPVYEGRISGTASLAGRAGASWTFAETRSDKVPLQPWGIHTVTFKMKKVGEPAPGEFYHFTAASPTGRAVAGFATDRYFRWDSAGNVFEAGTGSLADLARLRPLIADMGDYWFVKFTFYVDEYADYVLQWGINSANPDNRMIIDDFRLFYGKDYAYDLSVAPAEPQPLHVFDFEDGAPARLALRGYLVTKLPDLINGSVSFKGSAEPGTFWQEILRTDAAKLPLQSDSYYTISLRLKNPAPTAGYYQFAVCTDSHAADSVVRIGPAGTDAGSFGLPFGYRITEHDGVYLLTAVFRTGSEPGYRFEIDIYDGGSVVLDDLRIFRGLTASEPGPAVPAEKSAVPVLTERFESQDPADWNFAPQGGETGYRTEEVVNGRYSYVSRHTGGEYFISLESRLDRFSMKPNTQYRVLFRLRTLSQEGQFMLAAKTEAGGPLNDRFVRFFASGEEVPGVGNNAALTVEQRSGYFDVCVTLTTGDFEDYRLIFASVGSGDAALDDILVFEGEFFEPDAAPVPDVRPLTPRYAEDFEADRFGAAFRWKSGELTFKEGSVLNGARSYHLFAEPDPYGYAIPMESDPAAAVFETGASYTLLMRWKRIAGGDDDFFIVAFRGPAGDRYVKLRTDGTRNDGNERSLKVTRNGDVYELKATFTLSGTGPYNLAIVTQNRPEILLDDLYVYEGFLANPLPEAQVTPRLPQPLLREDFENHTAKGTLRLFPENGSYLTGSQALSGKFSYQITGSAAGVYTRALSSAPLGLSPGQTVTLFFRMSRTAMQTPDGFFQFAFKTPAGGPANDRYIRFNAEYAVVGGNHDSVNVRRVGDTAEITVRLTVGDFTDYEFAVFVYGVGTAAADDFEIYVGPVADPAQPAEGGEPVPAVVIRENFEGDSQLFETKAGSYGIDGPSLLNGAVSLKLRTNPDPYGYTMAATAKTDRLALAPLGVYTVSLRYKFLKAPSAGGYAMLAFRTGAGGPLNDRYIRFMPGNVNIESNCLGISAETVGDEVRMTVTFLLENFNDYKLEFLLFGTETELLVDDVAVFEGVAADRFAPASPAAKTPEQIETGRVFTENFEHNGAAGPRFFLRQGAMTFEENEILNGSFSLRAAAAAPGQWMDAFVSNMDTVALKPGRNYTLVFKFRELVPTGEAGFVQTAARVPGGDGLKDRYIRFKTDGRYVGGNAAYEFVGDCGAYRTAAFTFEAGSEPMELVLSIFDSGTIVIDDLTLFESVVYAADTSAPSVKVPSRNVDAEDSPVNPGSSLYDIPKGTVPPARAPAEGTEYLGEFARDPYREVEKIVDTDTVEREEPYEETIHTDAVIQKIVRRFTPKSSNRVLILVLSLSGAAAIAAGTVIFFILRKKRKKA